MRLRGLVDSDTFKRKVADAEDWERLDDALQGLYLAIARNAEAFPSLEGQPHIRLAKTIRVGHMPQLLIVFRIVDDDLVELLDLDFIESGDT